eukprot:1905111-Pleurochrysis_carterae.AAC.2
MTSVLADVADGRQKICFARGSRGSGVPNAEACVMDHEWHKWSGTLKRAFRNERFRKKLGVGVCLTAARACAVRRSAGTSRERAGTSS